MGISFHAVVVFGLGKNLLFKSILGRCGIGLVFFRILQIFCAKVVLLLHYFENSNVQKFNYIDQKKTFVV